MGKTYVGDVPEIRLDTEADLSGVIGVSIVALKPDGTTEVEWSATVDGTEVVYQVDDDDLDQAGTWKLQAKVTTTDGPLLGETVKRRVYEPFH